MNPLLPMPETRPKMNSDSGSLKLGIRDLGDDDLEIKEEVAALAVIIGAFAAGLRPDLDQAYLFEYSLSLVKEMTEGESGISNEDAYRLGQLVSDGARPMGKGDVKH